MSPMERPSNEAERAALAPPEGDTWIGLSASPLPVAEAAAWAVRPTAAAWSSSRAPPATTPRADPRSSGSSTRPTRSRSFPAWRTSAGEARARWPVVGRIALLHRVGVLEIGESAVVVAVSAPHRDEAFAAARFCIDTLKRSVPIWKRESWTGGESWGLEAQHIVDAGAG